MPRCFSRNTCAREEFDAGSAARSSKVYKHIYNLLAENAYTGALSLTSGDEVSAVSAGELGCAVVGTTALPKKALSRRLRSARAAADGGGRRGRAGRGVGARRGGARQPQHRGHFGVSRVALLLQPRHAPRAANPARPRADKLLITRDALWSALIALNTGEIVALPSADSDFAVNRADFERDIRARLAFLAQ